MEKSFLHFKATHPDWQPDPASSVFLNRMRDHLSSSVYTTGTGGRGLGLGSRMDESMARSKAYDRQRTISGPLRGGLRGVPQINEEDERQNESDEDEGDFDGWNKGVMEGRGDEKEGEEGDEGFLRDVGMIGLLQQVLNR